MVQAELAIDRLEAQTDVTVPSYYFIWPLSPPLWMFLGCEVKCACQPSGCFQRRYHGCIFSEKSMTIKFLFDSRPLMHRSSGRLSWEGVLWSGRSKLCSYFCCSLWQRGKLLRDGKQVSHSTATLLHSDRSSKAHSSLPRYHQTMSMIICYSPFRAVATRA